MRPAGAEISVARTTQGFQGPLGSALSPGGQKLLSVSSAATRINSADLFDLRRGVRTGTVAYDSRRGIGEAVFYGVTFSPGGKRAWASGGGQNVVHVYDVGKGLRETGQIPTPYFPAGLAYGKTPRGDRIYVANNLGGVPGATNPPGHTVTVIDPKTNHVTGTIDLGVALQPYGVTFGRSGRKAYVTNWMGRSVSVIDTRTERVRRRIILSPPTDPLKADHPNAIVTNPRRHEVYTANGNSDTVSVIDARRDRVIRTMAVGLVRGARPGAMPSGLAVSPDGKRLYVALGGENAIAVLDLVHRKRIGFIPTAWNPTDVDITRDGKKLVITTANAAGHRPTRCAGPYAVGDCSTGDLAYTTAATTRLSTKGGISVVRTPRKMKRLRKLTKAVLRNNRVRARLAKKPPALRAIRHVIYVIKENRTYDQVLGNLGKGDGDPKLNLFGEDSAPNHRELARRFTLFDNFFADADVSADGLSWTVSAGVSDYIDKTWPITYSPGRAPAPPRARLRARGLRRAVPDRAARLRPHDLPRRGRADPRLPVGQRLQPQRQLPRLRLLHEDPGRLRRHRQHVGDHPPRRPPLRRPRRRALPGLQHGLLRPRRARARVGARVRQLRGAVPRQPRQGPAARAVDPAAPERPHLRHDAGQGDPGELLRRQRPRARPHRRPRLQEPVLAQHRDPGHRGRRAERPRPRRRAPHARLRDQPLHADRAGSTTRTTTPRGWWPRSRTCSACRR